MSETADDRAGQPTLNLYGDYTLDELRLMHEAATPAPWQEFAESGDWWIQQADADGGPILEGGWVCNSNNDIWAKQADINLTTAAHNALPALLEELRARQAGFHPDNERWKAVLQESVRIQQEREIANLKLQHIYKAAELEYAGADPITALRNLRDERDEAQVECGHLQRALKALCVAYDAREWGQLYDAFQVARPLIEEEPTP